MSDPSRVAPGTTATAPPPAAPAVDHPGAAVPPRRSRNRLVAAMDPRKDVGRFASLDGYRAVAAIGVLVYHVAGYARISTGDNPLAMFVHNVGNFGVAVFFLLSGFLLYRPFAAAHFRGTAPPEPVGYLRRRLVRIWPAYTVALGAFLALGLNTARNVGPDYYFTLFTLTQVYRRAYGFAGLAVAWTLCVEVAFYLALPLLAGGIRYLGRGATTARMKLEAQVAGLATMYAVALIYRWLVAAPAQYDTVSYPFAVFHLWLPNFLDWFALGMLLAVCSVWTDLGRALPAALQRLADTWWLSWLAGAVCFGVLMVARGGGLDDAGGLARETPELMFLRFFLNGAAAFFFLLPAILATTRDDPGNRALSHVVPMYLGTVSYGIYLWHKVFLDKLKEGHEVGASRYSFWVMLALVFGLAVLAASLSYFLVEKPFLRFKDRRRREKPGREVP
jgi:peptidoglycan/LPS O-acetylase OafA/YrhL